jgi:hypothetical protein
MRALVQSYALVATLLFVLVSAAVALRLVLLSLATRRKPELLLGLGILGTAVLGYGTMIAAQLMRGETNAVASSFAERAVQGAGEILHDAGATMMVLFVVTVFRPGEHWAKALAAALLASLWGGNLGWQLENGFRSAGIGNGFWWLRYAVIWTYPLWTMVESYRYYALMRRRLALGLGDALVTNRFLLWGTGSLGTALAIWISSLSFFLIDRPEQLAAWSPVIEVSTASVGVLTVAIFYLTFLPPAWYRHWVAAAAERERAQRLPG